MQEAAMHIEESSSSGHAELAGFQITGDLLWQVTTDLLQGQAKGWQDSLD